MVYPLNEAEVIKHVGNMLKMPKAFPGEYLEVSRGAIVIVKGGYLLISPDCCYQVSDTEAVGSVITETLKMAFKKGFREPTGPGAFANHPRGRFSSTFPAENIVKYFCMDPLPLKDFMGGRYNYNPRIIKNMRDVIAIINDLNNRTDE